MSRPLSSWLRFDKEVYEESDRACVIIAAIVLEAGIEKLLRRRMLPGTSTDRSLFDGSNAPIGNFAAKIDLAYHLGLVPPPGARALHLVRKIRNHVAHNLEEATFEARAKEDRVSAIVDSLGLSEFCSDFAGAFEQEDGPRLRFELAVGIMLRALDETDVSPVDPVSWPEWNDRNLLDSSPR